MSCGAQVGGRAAPGLSLGLRISEMSLPTKLRPAISGSSRATGLLCPPGPQAALLPDLPGPLAFHPTPFLTGPWFVCLSRERVWRPRRQGLWLTLSPSAAPAWSTCSRNSRQRGKMKVSECPRLRAGHLRHSNNSHIKTPAYSF